MKNYDKIIIGAGLYGLYSADFCGSRGQNILLLECEDKPFNRATYINQARVHMGYHYPRSYSTAILSRNYFDRFVKDFGFCIKKDFLKIYAISDKYSWTNDVQFEKFCKASNIKCTRTNPERFFKSGACSGVFETEEYTYDARLLADHFISSIAKHDTVEIRYNSYISSIERVDDKYIVTLQSGEKVSTSFILNATYASVNQITSMLKLEQLKIKYEICEIILCTVSENIKDVGLTVMDGPFFSVMPFGKTGLHSLTSVTFTPHVTSYNNLPTFKCQKLAGEDYCSPDRLGNCNSCKAKPDSAYNYMSSLAKKYLSDDIEIKYHSSLFSMKPILQASEIDDSRPTVIKKITDNPIFISVLSGKINTVYDLDEFIK